jgi:hypothetical protein
MKLKSDAKPLEEMNHSPAGLGIESVVVAGDEEGNLHKSLRLNEFELETVW